MEQPLMPAQFIKTLQFCERKLFLEEALKMRSPSSKTDLKRAIFEEALRYTNRGEAGVVQAIKGPSARNLVEDLYYANNRRALQEAIINNKEKLAEQEMSIIDTHKQLWSDLRATTRDRVNNTFDFMTKNRVYANDLWWQLIPKITYQVKVSSPKLGIQTIIHRVDSYPHSAVPYLISRQDPPEKGMWTSHRYELAAAMMLLAEQGLIVQEGVVAYQGGKEERPLELTADLQEQVQERIKRARQVLKERRLPPRTDNMRKCDACHLKDKCYDDQYMQAKMHELTGQVTF